MFKKLLPIAGVVFIAALVAARTDIDEKVEDDIQPLLMIAAKVKAALNAAA